MLHYHGEAESSIPPASSIYYHDSVRTVMYPGLSYGDSVDALGDWYRFFLVPGAGYCGVGQTQPRRWPNDAIRTVVDWVERGAAPVTLAATITEGSPLAGQAESLCPWSKRPLWRGEGTQQIECEFDQASADSWTYTFDAFKAPIY